MRKVYKVVRRTRRGQAISAVMCTEWAPVGADEWRSIVRRFRRVYQKPDGTKPIVKRSLAFGSLRSASAWAGVVADWGGEIWEAECESYRRQAFLALWSSLRAMLSFRDREGARNGWDSFSAPRGTLLCKNLRLVKRVY